MKHISGIVMLLPPVCFCSCATVLPKTDPDHQAISAVIRTHVQNDETKVASPIRIKIRGNKAIARYTVIYRTAQQPLNPMKSTLAKQDKAWAL